MQSPSITSIPHAAAGQLGVEVQGAANDRHVDAVDLGRLRSQPAVPPAPARGEERESRRHRALGSRVAPAVCGTRPG